MLFDRISRVCRIFSPTMTLKTIMKMSFDGRTRAASSVTSTKGTTKPENHMLRQGDQILLVDLA